MGSTASSTDDCASTTQATQSQRWPAPPANCSMELLESRVLCSAGALDKTFAKAGIAWLFGSDGNTDMTRSTLQIDGKLLVWAGPRARFPYVSITRYNPNGSRDSSFGSEGRILLSDPTTLPPGIAVQRDGKILTARQVGDDWRLTRYLPNGKLDTRFGTKGLAAAAPDRLLGITQWKNWIFAVRYTSGFQLERYLMNGKLDPTFGKGGVVHTNLPFDPGSKSFCETLAVQDDGKVVVVGNANEHFALARYTWDGQLDPEFNKTGTLVTDLPSGSEAITYVFIQRDKKILVTGRNMGRYGYTFAMARYLADGQLDKDFADGGTLITDVPAARPAALQSDGKIVIVGSDSRDALIARYNTNGRPDTTFGRKGIVRVDLGGTEDPREIFIQGKDNRLLLLTRSVFAAKGYLVMLRYLSR